MTHGDWLNVGLALSLFALSWYRDEIRKLFSRGSKRLLSARLGALKARKALVEYFVAYPPGGNVKLWECMFGTMRVAVWTAILLLVATAVRIDVPDTSRLYMVARFLNSFAFGAGGFLFGALTAEIKEGRTWAQYLLIPQRTINELTQQIAEIEQKLMST